MKQAYLPIALFCCLMPASSWAQPTAERAWAATGAGNYPARQGSEQRRYNPWSVLNETPAQVGAEPGAGPAPRYIERQIQPYRQETRPQFPAAEMYRMPGHEVARWPGMIPYAAPPIYPGMPGPYGGGMPAPWFMPW